MRGDSVNQSTGFSIIPAKERVKKFARSLQTQLSWAGLIA